MAGMLLSTQVLLTLGVLLGAVGENETKRNERAERGVEMGVLSGKRHVSFLSRQYSLNSNVPPQH
jgi:hypothetical protein